MAQISHKCPVCGGRLWIDGSIEAAVIDIKRHYYYHKLERLAQRNDLLVSSPEDDTKDSSDAP